MAMNIMVVDAGRLAGDADFPPLEAERFGWSQYGETPAEELAERCWRSHVVVTAATPVGAAALEAMPKVQLIAIAGGAADLVDVEAAAHRGVAVCHVPGADAALAADTDRICRETVANIDAFLRGEPRNRLA